jgi:hypothetical protein
MHLPHMTLRMLAVILSILPDVEQHWNYPILSIFAILVLSLL